MSMLYVERCVLNDMIRCLFVLQFRWMKRRRGGKYRDVRGRVKNASLMGCGWFVPFRRRRLSPRRRVVKFLDLAVLLPF